MTRVPSTESVFPCSVPPQLESKRAPEIRQLDESELAEVKRIIADRSKPSSVRRLGKAVSLLSRQQRTQETLRIVGQVLADRSVSSVHRATAAIELSRMAPREAEKYLIAQLDQSEPIVQIRVIQSLGVIGGTDALKALDEIRVERPAIRNQYELARQLIIHRLGLTDRETECGKRSPNARKQLEDGESRRIDIDPLDPKRIAARVRGLAGKTYGIELADDVGFVMGDVETNWHMLFNKEARANDWSLLRNRPVIFAMMTETNQLTGEEAITQLVLTSPRKDALAISGYRTDGSLLFDGHGRLEREIPFSIDSIDRPGQCVYHLAGTLNDKGVTWTEQQSSGSAINKLLTLSE